MYRNHITIPSGADSIVSSLLDSGFDAYIVGGCVRDSLLGLTPNDWDICTAARPEEVARCLAGRRIIETGLQHGTVTVVMEDGQYEVTTFRVDGAYSDCRRPDEVEFVSSVEEDLARRDFTMNAMAYNERAGLVDPFGGAESLRSHIVSCVGNADDRFREDGLRIMRALRFSSVFGFSIDGGTAQAIHRNAALLRHISMERIRVELCRLLHGEGVLDVLLHYHDVITTIIPELAPCVGFDQRNIYHSYTVYDHIAHAVSNYKGAEDVVAVALLLHDIGKPLCYTEDENGGHFYGHGKPGAEIADAVLTRLRFDNQSRRDIRELVLFHDAVIDPTPRIVRRWLNMLGEKQFFRLMDLRLADILAHANGTQASRIGRRNDALRIAEEIISSQQCYSLSGLAVHGQDILAMGIPEGKRVGALLKEAMFAVLDGRIENSKDELCAFLQEVIASGRV